MGESGQLPYASDADVFVSESDVREWDAEGWRGGFRRGRMLSLLCLRPLILRRCSLRNGSHGSMIFAWKLWMMSPGTGVGRGSW